SAAVDSFYRKNDYKNIWSTNEKWDPITDSIYDFIRHAEYFGLFPSDYHYNELESLKLSLQSDSLAKSDANLWTKADLMLTDAFIQISKHLKHGRLLPDSLSLIADSSFSDEFFIKNLTRVFQNRNLASFFTSLEPI